MARAVQQLVGHQQSEGGSLIATAVPTSKQNSSNERNSSVKSAFHPTAPAVAPPTSPVPQTLPYPPSSPAAPSNPFALNSAAITYPSALRMMYPTGVMPFLHPSSAAYFAAAAANQSWLFASHHRPVGPQHICLPDCSQCSVVPGTSSSSPISGETKGMMPSLSELELFKNRKDFYSKS